MEELIDKNELWRHRRNKPTTEYLAIMNDKKEQVLDILRELPPVDARYILSEIKRKMDNDEISVEFLMKE